MEKLNSDLIIGHLQGTLSEVEKEQFYTWVNKSQENKDFFFELKTVYDASLMSMRKYDIEKSWKKLLRKRRTRFLSSKRFYITFSKYAAVILITALTTILIQTSKNNSENIYYKSGDGIVADQIILPDGTQVNLSANTEFHYNTDFGKSNRTVYLDGEGYFDVNKHDDLPFIVKVQYQDIEALGTKFNVMAYKNDSINMATLLEGSIRIVTKGITEEAVILSPDQQLEYNKEKNELLKKEVDASTYANWVNGYYDFDGQTFGEMLNKLGDLYGVEFVIESEELKNKRYNTKFYRDQSINEILEIFKTSIGINYNISEKQIYIH